MNSPTSKTSPIKNQSTTYTKEDLETQVLATYLHANQRLTTLALALRNKPHLAPLLLEAMSQCHHAHQDGILPLQTTSSDTMRSAPPVVENPRFTSEFAQDAQLAAIAEQVRTNPLYSRLGGLLRLFFGALETVERELERALSGIEVGWCRASECSRVVHFHATVEEFERAKREVLGNMRSLGGAVDVITRSDEQVSDAGLVFGSPTEG